MRRQNLIYIVIIILFTGCSASMEDNAVQMQIDSTVRAKEEQLRNELKYRNDSIINMDARRRADSILGIKTTETAPDTARRRDTSDRPVIQRPVTPQ